MHISTDYVFDGFKGDYVEQSITHPLNYYGKCKLESENMLIGSNREHLIFRVSTLFDSCGNNFFMWVANELKENNQVKVATDIENNPTWIPSFSNAIIKSIYLDISGLFHYGTDRTISRFEFAILIAEKFNYNRDLIVPVKSEDIGFEAQRPKKTNLVSNKLSNLIGVNLESIEYVMKVVS